MKRKSQKVLSTLISSLMTISMVSAAPISVEAKTELENQKNQLKEKIRQAYKGNQLDLKSVKLKRNEENLPRENKENPEEKVRIIVETDKKSLKDMVSKNISLTEAAKDKNLINKVDKSMPLKRQLKRIDSKIKINKNYSVLLNGFSAEVQRKDIDKIRELQGVKHVTVVKKYYPDMTYSKSLTEAEKVWKDLGYKGEGMVVSIIDTGIDWHHKDMRLTNPNTGKLKKDDIAKIGQGKGRWYSEKVPYGYNFADNGTEVIDRTDSMHGMHVAGIVGANCQSPEEIKQNKGIKGVAPEAQLLAMKVFSNDPNGGGAYADDIVAAIEDSVIHGADVINMSLGSTAAFQDPKDAEQKAIREAVESGTSVIVSAGNSQYALAPYRLKDVNDTGLLGAPGLAEDSLQVASSENTKSVFPAITVKIGSENLKIPYTISEIAPDGILNDSYELVDCGRGKAAEISGKNLKNKIALIQRGELSFAEKKLNAQKAGAKGVIIYNNDNDEGLMTMISDPAVKIPSAFIRYSDGMKLKQNGTKVSFLGEKLAIENININDMSSFTSWGPTPNLDFKPEITAPGGQIWSTVNNNKYVNMSGTSMASPHMAGSMALIRQHINKLEKEGKIKFKETTEKQRQKVEFTNKLAVNTAKVMMEKDQSKHKGIPYSPRRQGAGIVNTEEAIKNKVTVEYKDNGKPVVALKEIGSEKEFTLKLHNYGDNSVTYNVKPLNDNVLTEMNEASSQMSYDTTVPSSHVIVNKDTVTVEPGKDAEVSVTIRMGLKAQKNSFAEGFIRFEPKAKDIPEIGIPFMGFYGDWNAMPALDAPVWHKDNKLVNQGLSKIGSTLVATKKDGKINFLGYMGEDKNQKPIIDEDKMAISSKEGANNAVAPIVVPLRNIKDLKIQVINEKGNVVRTVASESEIRKVVLGNRGERGFRFDANWAWDGKIYNPSTAKYEIAPDGNYKIRLASKIDYDKASYQNLDMKVKMDSTEPTVKVLDVQQDKSNKNSYTVKFKAEENGQCNSGIKGFTFLVNKNLYTDASGKSLITNLKKDENGNYVAKLDINKPVTEISVGAIDYAENVGISEYKYEGQALKATFLQNGTPVENMNKIKPGNLDMNISVNPVYLDELSNIKIKLGPTTIETINIKENVTQYTYTLKDIKPGKNTITIIGINKLGNELARQESEIFVQDKNFKINFDNINAGMSVNTTEYEVKGSFTAIPDEFTINGEKVTNIKESSEAKKYTFSHKVKLEPNKMNKVKVHYRKADLEKTYAYNVYCDPYAPEITLNCKDAQKTSENEYTIKVPYNTEKYNLEGTVKDDGYGYEFFINGDSMHKVFTYTPYSDKTTYNFKKEIKLTAKTNIVRLEAKDDVGNERIVIVKIVKDEQPQEAKEEKLFIEKIGMKDTYKNGEQFKGGVRVKNTTNESKSITLIVGVYDENENMVNVNLSTQVIGKGATIDVYSVCNIPTEGNYKIRCFVWDSLEFMTPLSEIIEIPVIH